MGGSIDSVYSRLKDELGEEWVSRNPIVLRLYSRDYSPLDVFREARGERLTMPSLVVWPGSTEEVSKVLSIASEYKVPVVPYGGGSGVLGGAKPVKGSIALDLSRMNRIREFNPDDMMVTVEAGLILSVLEEFLNGRGYTTGHIPQSMPEAEVGGLIATRSSGQFSTGYGNIEDLVVGLEYVLADGTVVKVKPVPRRSVGPETIGIMIGSEGTLAVITAATLRIRRLPSKTVYTSFAIESFGNGLEAVREIMLRELPVPLLRLYDTDETSIRFSRFGEAQGKNLLLVGVSGEEPVVDAAYNVIRNLVGYEELGPEPVEYWLKKRFDVISEIQSYAPAGIVYDTIEVSGTWSRLPRIYQRVKEALLATPGVVAVLVHASHFYINGGALYFTVAGSPIEGESLQRFYRRFWSAAMKATLEGGGSISHHHGIGAYRRRWVSAERKSELPVLRSIKNALDPENLLNPGKTLP